MKKRKIIIGSRESSLACRQSELIMRTIAQCHPELELELVTMKTTGDRILDRPLDQIGGKGLFVKELDIALAQRRIDISVHSLKDMPMYQPEGLPILAYSKRADPRDVLVLPRGETMLNPQKPIGCSSARRRMQLTALYPDMEVKPVRGNILTRLEKLEQDYAALVLAYAGIARLDLEERISRIFSPAEILPAAGQGILAVQGRAEEDYSFLQCVQDEDACCAALAERTFVRALDGGCSSPIAAHAVIEADMLTLTGLFAAEGSSTYVIDQLSGPRAQPVEIGERLVEKIRRRL